MPKLIEKLSREETTKKYAKTEGDFRRAYLTEYSEYLSDIEEGGSGQLALEEGEKKQTIKNRLLAAAKLSEMNFEFLGRDPSIVAYRRLSDEDY